MIQRACYHVLLLPLRACVQVARRRAVRRTDYEAVTWLWECDDLSDGIVQLSLSLYWLYWLSQRSTSSFSLYTRTDAYCPLHQPAAAIEGCACDTLRCTRSPAICNRP